MPTARAGTTYRSSILKLLDERGYIHQLTDAAPLDVLAEREVVTGYRHLPCQNCDF